MSINGLSRLTYGELLALVDSILWPTTTPQACWAQIDGATWFGMPGEGWSE